MFKNFIMKQLLKKQMKDIPQEQQDKIFKMLDEHPDFFEKIALNVKQKMDSGKDQQSAMMEVMREHQDELKKIMS